MMRSRTGDNSDTWTTLSLVHTEMGLTARERFERFKLEAMSEMALRLVGGLIVASSTMLWLVLPTQAGSEELVSHGVLATLFTATGLILYAYGSRGFRRQLALDAKQGTLSLTKININDQSRVARNISVRDISSLFLRRANGRPDFAALYVRVKGAEAPQLALTGDTAELEYIHQALCEIVHHRGGKLEPVTEQARQRVRKLMPARV